MKKSKYDQADLNELTKKVAKLITNKAQNEG